MSLKHQETAAAEQERLVQTVVTVNTVITLISNKLHHKTKQKGEKMRDKKKYFF